MEKIGDLLNDLSIRKNIPRASTPSSSDLTDNSNGRRADDEGRKQPGTGVNQRPSGIATPSSYLLRPSSLSQPEDVCPHCGGAGWLRMDVAVGDPRFGKTYPCVCRTQATEQRNLEELYHLSNLDAFQEKILGTFDPDVYGASDAYWAAKEFAENPEGWLVLMGGYGCGKTHLAAAIANHVLQGRMQVYFAVAPDLLHNLRSAYAPGSEITYDDRFEQIRSVYLLIVDDLGAEQSTPWAVEKLYQIFNYRYNLRLPTVVTSNCDLDRLDPRICSRLCDQDLCRHVFMEAQDYRMRRVDPRIASQKASVARTQEQGAISRPQQYQRRSTYGNKQNGTR